MYQQKQQKHSGSETQSLKDPQKMGLFFKKALLPSIQTRSNSRSKSHHNLQKFISPKRMKVPDIYYEMPEVNSKNNHMNMIITQRDSKNELTMERSINQQEKPQTVMKANLNTKPTDRGANICEKHVNKRESQTEGTQQKMSKIKSNLKDSRTRHCCQTQPSEQSSINNLKVKLNHPHHNSLPQTTKNSTKKIQTQKIKPIKTNFYQKPQIFGPVPQKLLPPIDRSQFQRYFISKNQEKAIVQKLSKPKHQIQCVRKNCQCFNESRLGSSSSPKNRNFSGFDIREINASKIRINVDKLKKINCRNCPEVEDECSEHGLKRKIKQKRSQKKKKSTQCFQRYDTEPFVRNPQKFNNENYAQSKAIDENIFISTKSKIQQQSESFITGLVKPQKIMFGRETQNKKKQQKDDGFDPEKVRKVSIKIQTQDILIVKKQQPNVINSLEQSAIKSFNFNLPLAASNGNTIKTKKSTLSKSSIRDLQNIGYTFGSKGNSARKVQPNSCSEQLNDVEEYYAGKTRDQIIQKCAIERQYWLYYQIQNGLFHDLSKPMQKINLPLKQKINLVSSVFKEDMIIKVPVKQQKQVQKPSLDISQISSIPNIERLNSIPISIDIKNTNKPEIPQGNCNVLSKPRNSASPYLTRSHINMFSRSPKSTTSSRARKCFKIPKESEYVEFVKNYKPINPQIKISNLLQEENCKVIPSASKLFFGQIIGDSIKHGLGVQVSLNEIFEGQYVDGSRKEGYLKVHDGIYQGKFENNLKHGHGIFRWDNGQVFEGQWKMGSKNGFGVWTSPDGSYYEGQWHLNMQHGKGKHVHSSGVYEGEFKNFRKQGTGKQSFPNGDKFMGEYKNGKPNGKGKYEWSSGTYYEGEFVDGLKEGKGVWHQSANTYYEGMFYKDMKHGQGTEYYKDGTYMEGIFINGTLSEGTHYSTNKKLIRTVQAKKQ